jgi:hypothetical protein
MIAMAIKGYLRIKITEIIQQILVSVCLAVIVATILLS